MVTVNNVETQLKEMLDVANRAFTADNSAGYESLDRDFRRLEASAREAFQARMENLVWPIVEKLENDQSLTSAEQEMLELMIVGEAKYYVKSENDLENWKNEVERLLAEIKQLREAGLDDPDALLRLRAFCREAFRIVPDLTFFYQEKERVARFQSANKNALDRDSRRILANLVREMLTSDKV